MRGKSEARPRALSTRSHPPAERWRVLFKDLCHHPNLRGGHVEAQGSRKDRSTALHVAQGGPVHRCQRSEIGHVPGGWSRKGGMVLAHECDMPAGHKGRGVGRGGAVKLGVLPC